MKLETTFSHFYLNPIKSVSHKLVWKKVFSLNWNNMLMIKFYVWQVIVSRFLSNEFSAQIRGSRIFLVMINFVDNENNTWDMQYFCIITYIYMNS